MRPFPKVMQCTGAALLVCAVSAAPAAAGTSARSGEEPVGGDRTAQGCITSAGYIWSQVRKACIRLFEAGKPLHNVRNPEATSVAYVVGGGGQMPLELFLPDAQKGVLMFFRNGAWHDDDGRYVLSNDDNDVLEVRNPGGKLLFSSLKPKS